MSTGKELQGQTIAGRYELLASLGKGTHAEVWRARQVDTDVEVAIKILSPAYSSNPSMVEDFLADAKSFVAFRDNPRIATILDCGHDLDTETEYVVMTLLEEGVERILEHTGPFSIERTYRLAKDVGSALRTIHRAGLVHGDVKASNVMTVAGDDRFVLTDFGVGLAEDMSEGTAPTMDMSRLGNWTYTSPERIRATKKEEVTASADIYSLGVVLFRAATGTFPFTSSFPQIVDDHLRKTPPDPRTIRPEIPAALAQLILRCLQKSPGSRFHSMDEFLSVLEEARTTKPRKLPIEIPKRALLIVGAGLLVILIAVILVTTPRGSDLMVQSRPDGASFRLYRGSVESRFDVAETGTTPKNVTGLQGADYTLVMEMEGYFPKEVIFDLGDGGEGPGVVVLEKMIEFRIRSEPPGAQSTLRALDGQDPIDGGRTPADFSSLRAGPYELVLRLENFATLIDTIRIDRDSDGGSVVRQLIGGGLVAMELYTEPEGATIYVDGLQVEETSPCRIPNLVPGKHRVEVERSGYAPIDTSLVLDPDVPVLQLVLNLDRAGPGQAGGTREPREPRVDPNDPTPEISESGTESPSERQRAARLERLKASIPGRIRAGDWEMANRELEVLTDDFPDEPEIERWSRQVADGLAATQIDPSEIDESDREAIRRTLSHYEEALEARDINAFSRLWVALPGNQRREFESAFSQIKSQDLIITERSIRVDGVKATLRFHELRKIKPKTGDRIEADRERSMELRRLGGGDWLISTLK